MVQIVAVAGFVGGEPRHLQVAQVLQSVALAVGVRAHGRVAQLRARLDVEQEEQPVHVAQALSAQGTGQGVVQVEQLVVAHFAHVADDLVADQLDRLPKRVLQVLGHGEGVLVAVLVQAVQQAMALPVRGQQAVAVEQDGGRLERGVVPAAQDLGQVEAQHPVVRPLAALHQQRLAERQQQYPARRMVLAEHAAGRDLLPALVQQRRQRGRLAVELGRMRLERERVVALRGNVVGFQHQQLGRGAQHRQLHAVVHHVVGRAPVVLVAQGVEQAATPATLLFKLPGVAFRPSLELVAEARVVAGQGAQGHVGCRLPVRGLRLPPLHGFLDVAGEDLGQVMVAVELVLVVDSGEGGGSGEGHGRGQSCAEAWNALIRSIRAR